MADSSKTAGWPRRYGRYLVFEEFARGGMASVHLGRLVADRGFSRLVAVKMLSQDRAASSFYARALEDEARIASRVRHPNVVQPLDVVAEGDDVLYVMEYVHGVALGHLLDASRTGDGRGRLAADVAVAIMLDLLSALHAAHEAKDETGRPLGVVHRDVSPQNVLVGVDGLARLADFGVAKAMRREERTATGAVKGKAAYMSPEQQRGLPVTRQADVYAAGVVLAASLTGAPPAPADADRAAGWLRAMIARIDDAALLDVVVTATKPQARERFGSAAEMAAALATCARASQESVGACVQDLAGEILDQRAELARRVENTEPPPTASSPPPAPAPAVGAPEQARSAREIGATASAATPARASSTLSPFLLFLLGTALALAIFVGRAALLTAPTPALAPAPEPPTSTAPPPPTVSPASPPPSPSSVAPPGPPSARPRVRPARVAPPTSATTQSPSPPAVDCDPPFRIDAQGRKHYKPECNP